MRLFYHHVGEPGATRDFPKTVFSRIPLSVVDGSIPDGDANKAALLMQLKSAFPDGTFNCWGVPSGAGFVIRTMTPGDVVLLIESIRLAGSIPALAQVLIFQPVPFPTLSEALWGDERYPYIFFFNTTKITLAWLDFLEHVGYKPRLNPRGQFLVVGDDRWEKYGGAEGYVDWLLEGRSRLNKDILRILENLESEVPDSAPEYIADLHRELQNLLRLPSDDVPALTAPAGEEITESRRRVRSDAFRIGVRRLYRSQCCFCGARRKSPKGIPEVQGAHVYPKEHNGNDDVRNGICLCVLHHWAFDCGWLSLTDDLRIIGRPDLPGDNNDYRALREVVGESMSAPIDVAYAPHPIFLKAHRRLNGFED